MACHHEMLILANAPTVLNMDEQMADRPTASCQYTTICTKEPPARHDTNARRAAADECETTTSTAASHILITANTISIDNTRQAGTVNKRDSEMESGIETDSDGDSSQQGGTADDQNTSPVVDVELSTCHRRPPHRSSTEMIAAVLYDPNLSLDEFIARAMVRPPPPPLPPPPSRQQSDNSTLSDETVLIKYRELLCRPPPPPLPEYLSTPSKTSGSSRPRDRLPLAIGAVKTGGDSPSLLDVTLEEKYARLVTPPPPSVSDTSNQLNIDNIINALSRPKSEQHNGRHVSSPISMSKTNSLKTGNNNINNMASTAGRRSPVMLNRQLSLPVSHVIVNGCIRQESSSSDTRYLMALHSPPSVRQRRHPLSMPPPTPPKNFLRVNGVVTLPPSGAPSPSSSINGCRHHQRPVHPPPSPPVRTSSVQNSPVVSSSVGARSRRDLKCALRIGRNGDDTTEHQSSNNGICAVLDTNIMSSQSPPSTPAVLRLPTLFDPAARRDSTGSSVSDAPSTMSSCSKTASIRSSALRSPTSSHAVVKTSSTQRPTTSSLSRGVELAVPDDDGQHHQGRSYSLTSGSAKQKQLMFGAIRSKLRSYWNRNKKSSSWSLTTAADCDGPSVDHRHSLRTSAVDTRREMGSSNSNTVIDINCQRKSPPSLILPVNSFKSDTNDGYHGDGDDVTLSAEDDFRKWSSSADGNNGGIILTHTNGSLESFTGNR